MVAEHSMEESNFSAAPCDNVSSTSSYDVGAPERGDERHSHATVTEGQSSSRDALPVNSTATDSSFEFGVDVMATNFAGRQDSEEDNVGLCPPGWVDGSTNVGSEGNLLLGFKTINRFFLFRGRSNLGRNVAITFLCRQNYFGCFCFSFFDSQILIEICK